MWAQFLEQQKGDLRRILVYQGIFSKPIRDQRAAQKHDAYYAKTYLIRLGLVRIEIIGERRNKKLARQRQQRKQTERVGGLPSGVAQLTHVQKVLESMPTKL